MIDREKVTKGLECCEYSGCISCPYYIPDKVCNLNLEMLAFLKEQEPVKPKTENDGLPEEHACWWYVCGNCGCAIDPGDDYCRHCGRSVKWE